MIGHCMCLMQNLSSENEFVQHDNEPVARTHFYVNSFACRLVLTKRQKT